MKNIVEIENMCLNKLNSTGDCSPEKWEDSISFWYQFGINEMFQIGRKIDSFKKDQNYQGLSFKGSDGPVTVLEKIIEPGLEEKILSFNKDVKVCGEETGGEVPESGYALAIDPIDGTWAFLSGLDSYSSTMAVFKDKVPLLSFVLNNSVGELVVSIKGEGTRIIKTSPYLNSTYKFSLPLEIPLKDHKIVAFHTQRNDLEMITKLYKSWKAEEIKMVFSVTGSPSWMLSQAAKGCFTYIHSWSKARAKEFDLMPGIMMVKEAGGDVIDHQGKSIDGNNHLGLFIAGMDTKFLNQLKQILK